MTTNRSLTGQIWIDLNSPTKEEIDSLILTQNINPSIAKDLLLPTPTQNTKEDGEIIYTVLHIPTFKHAQLVQENQEVDFIIMANGMVTARYDSIDALHYFAKQIEVSEILNKSKNSHLFFGLMREIYKSMSDELAYTEDWTKEIEKNIFEGHEKAMVFSISNVGRNLLNFKRTVEPHGNMFKFLEEVGRRKFGEEFVSEAKSVMDEWHRIIKKLNNQMELVAELRETNNSMLSTKQNEIMKSLSVIGLVLLPLTIIGQIFGLSILSFPLKNNPFAFWIIVSLMAIAVISMLIYARLKKWL